MEFMMAGMIQFGGNFVPRGWAFCQGQKMDIAQNQALFSLLGTTWGGDGRTTFNLPDLRGRVPTGEGSGPGLSPVKAGDKFGAETQVINVNQLPAHSHTATFTPTGGGDTGISAKAELIASTAEGQSATPRAGDYLAQTKAPKSGPDQPELIYTSTKTAPVTLASDSVTVTVSGGGGITGGTVAVGNTGLGQQIPIMQPALVTPFIISTNGTFPSRS